MSSSKQLTPKRFGAQFDLVADDDVRLVVLTTGITLYTNERLSAHPGAILDTYSKFLDWTSNDALRFYATESMRQHKPFTQRARAMLPTWLKAGAPEREFIRIQIKSGVQYQDAPEHKFDVFGIEPKSKLFKLKYANSLSIAFPPQNDSAHARTLLERFLGICSVFPFRSGFAGYSFECSKYAPEASQTHAWVQSMRNRGIDISRPADDSIAVGQDAIKGIGWLTALAHDLVASMGGAQGLRRLLPSEVDVIDVPAGVVVQAGSMPSLGNVANGDSLPLQRSIYKLFAPIIETAAKRSPSFNLSTDYVERTEQWFTRLADG